jgi:hypothetical protein
MATLTVQNSARAVASVALTAAGAGGDEWVNTGKEGFLIDNQDAASKTVTFVTQATVDGEAVGDKAVVIPAGEMHILGPFPKSTYNDANEKVQVTYSAVTSLSVRPILIV